MNCLICDKSCEKSMCDDCINKKRCKDCNILKTDFYKYKNDKLYSTCKECFNKKVICEICNKEFNKTYLSKHLKRCHNNNDNIILNENNINTNNNNDNIITNNNNNDIITNNRTLIVGPSFCGKTHLLLNKLLLFRLDYPDRKIQIITRSPKQYKDIDIEEVSVEEDLGDTTIQDYENCCVVCDDMLDSNQKLIDPFFTRGRHNDLDVFYLSQSYFDLPKRTIRNNSNIIILFQQTLKDVENLYRDIAGFDMSYDEFKMLCREAWRDKYDYLEINRMENKKGEKYKLCNESKYQYRIFNPETDPF